MRNTTKPLKEITEPNKWRDIPCSQLGILNIVKISVLPNLTYRFNTIPMNIPTSFVNIDKLIMKLMWRGKRLRMVNTK